MTEEKELTEVTKEILERTENLKEHTKKSMVKGEVNIIRGIIIFETIIKEINPINIDEETIVKTYKYVDAYMLQKEDFTQSVNHYIHHGITLCYFILDLYLKEIKRRTLKNDENHTI